MINKQTIYPPATIHSFTWHNIKEEKPPVLDEDYFVAISIGNNSVYYYVLRYYEDCGFNDKGVIAWAKIPEYR